MKYTFILILLTFSCTVFSQAESLPLNITFNDSIGIGLNNESTSLDSIKYHKLGFNSIETYSPNFSYSYITLGNHLNFKIIVLQRDYVEENIHWVCIMKDNKLLDKVMSSYDNSEGFTNIKSSINNAEIQVKEWNIYTENQETVHYFLMTNNGIVKKTQ